MEKSIRNIDELNRYEEVFRDLPELCGANVDESVYYKCIADICRKLREDSREWEYEYKTIHDVALSVGAWPLFKFIEFVLKENKQEKLFFLARDGFILYEIAKIIKKRKGYNVELIYLELSRDVFTNSMVGGINESEFIRELRKSSQMLTLGELFERFNCVGIDLPDIVQKKKLLNKCIGDMSYRTLTKIIFSDQLKDHFYDSFKGFHYRLKKYLNQSGFISEKVGIVDVGWNLTIHDKLASILKDENKNPPVGYYFGINHANSDAEAGKKIGYLWDLRKNNSRGRYTGVTRIIEVFCSAPFGKTVDYMHDDDKNRWKPVYHTDKSDDLKDWGVEILNRAILKACVEFSELKDGAQRVDIDLKIIEKLLNRFWTKPTIKEIEVWGKYPFSVNIRNRKVVRLFRKRSFITLLREVFENRQLPYGEKDHWPYAHLKAENSFKQSIIKATLSISCRLKTN